MRLKDIDDSEFETWAEERDQAYVSFRKVFRSVDFYETRAWKDLRHKVLTAYGRVCMRCHRTHEETTIQVDHIKPRSLYPSLALSFHNMQVLCLTCNHDKGTATRDFRKIKLTAPR